MKKYIHLIQKIIGVFLLCLTFISIPIYAIKPYQPTHPDPVLESWRWQAFPELKDLGLRCMAEATDGAMWFGTDRGVQRYDGLEWKSYTVEKDQPIPINVLCATKDGRVYAGSDRGISQFDGQTWQRIFPPSGDFPWPIDQIIERADGSLWAATAWGGLKLGEKPTIYTTEAMASILRVQAPYVQIARVPDSVVPKRTFQKGTGIKVTQGGYLGISRSEEPLVVWALAPDGTGRAAGLQIGDHILKMDGIVPQLPHLTLDGQGAPVELLVKRPGLDAPFEVTLTRGPATGQYSGFSISDIFEDHDGNLWFGLSWGGEILRQDANGQWQVFSAKEGLVPGDRPRITQTRNGDIWIASNHFVAGLNKFDAQKELWIHYPFASRGGTNIHTSILETREGTLWVGGHNGLLHAFRNGVWTVCDPATVPISQTRIVGLLEASDGALWIAGLGQEATRLDYGTSRWTTFTDLEYQCETQEGSLWFISKDLRVVRKQSNGEWISYGPEDGLMKIPTLLTATQEGTLWATGSHNRQAATAPFHFNTPNKKRWSLKTHPNLAHSIDKRSVLESSNGTLWFGATVGREADQGQLGGVLNYDPKTNTWHHHKPPETPPYIYGIGQTADGSVWFGATGLVRFDPSADSGQATWSRLREPKGLTSWVHGVLGTQEGGLWVGTRAYGLFYLNPKASSKQETWKRYGVRDGLSNNRINVILQGHDKSVWVATDKGISRFDGQTWTTHALPVELLGDEMKLQQSQDGAIWIQSLLGAVRYTPETNPPETTMDVAALTVSQPGNATLVWHGDDPWRSTPNSELQYAWRLDKGDWSPFAHEMNKTFVELASGDHTFEVKTRDRDFNEDPTPATVHLYVTPPVWQQPWFLGLMGILCVAIGIQSGRVIRRDRRLQESNKRLHQQTDELATANRQIQEANRLKSQFLANMSHELRTPLNAIMGFTQLMTRDTGLTSGQRENLTVIGRSGEHLLALINDVLDMSKIEAGQTTLNEDAFDLYRLLDDLEGMFRLRTEGKALTLIFERSLQALQYVRTDESKLRQVLINLLGNAIKFTEAGQISLRVKGENTRLFFEVEDTGPGIIEEEQTVLFDAFVQTSAGQHVQEGTGLGLPISQEFVRLMGGEISVKSQIGRGATFTFNIPIEPTAADSVTIAGPIKRVVGLEPNQPTYRILVVEDRLENRRLLRMLLTSMGFEVQEATNGQEAVAIWEQWQPHFIWMDMRMPVMDGYEATRQIKAKLQGQTTVIVALTASAFEEQRTEVLSAGCDGFVRKPFKEEEIFETMAKHLGVRFIYEEETLAPPTPATVELSVETLSALPKEWVAQIYRAATQADADQIDTLLGEITNDALTEALRGLVNDFQFDKLMALTRWAEEEKQ